MHDDPFETRERGLRRVRTLTASVAAASLLGTGVMVYELARPVTANAQPTVQNGDDQQVAPDGPLQGPSDDRGFGDDGHGDGGQTQQGGVQPPAQPPAPAPQFHPHASSGGS